MRMKPLTLILRPGPTSNGTLLNKARLGAARDCTEDNKDCSRLIPSFTVELAGLISVVSGGLALVGVWRGCLLLTNTTVFTTITCDAKMMRTNVSCDRNAVGRRNRVCSASFPLSFFGS